MVSKSQKLGNQAENLVYNYLKSKNYTILTRNYWTPYGELDIVATKNKTIYVVEVRSRLQGKHNPVMSIDPQKQERLFTTTTLFLEELVTKQKDFQFDEVRFIVAAVNLDTHHPEIRLYFDPFLPSDR